MQCAQAQATKARARLWTKSYQQKAKKKKKETRTYFYCDKKGHIARNCRQPKKESTKDSANAVEAKEKDGGKGTPKPNDSANAVTTGPWPPSNQSRTVPSTCHFRALEVMMTMVIRIAPAWTTPTNALVSSIPGCTRHVLCYKDDFSSFHPIRPKPLSAANGEVFYATGEGGLAVYLQGRTLTLANVWYAEKVPCTLISFGSLDNAGFNVNLSDSRATVRDSQNTE